ncbi:MAG: hypothetical protein R3B84_01615 [Zavarzinella sp.]
MGASSWRYYTGYHNDPETALQALRTEVFARGEYIDPTDSIDETLRQNAHRFGQDPNSPEVQAEIDSAVRLQQAIRTGNTHGLSRKERALVERLRAFGQLAGQFGAVPPATDGDRPRSIDELLERAAESGTHSILDIEHTSSQPGFGLAVPLTIAQVRRVFGTTKPTHDQVELQWTEIAELLERWHARYMVVFCDEHPSEYAFIGCSGD